MPSCQYIWFSPRSETLKWAISMIFTIREINHNDTLLPNITLGYDIRDDCYTPSYDIKTGLKWMEGKIGADESSKISSPQAIIGPYITRLTKVLSTALGLFYVPQVRKHNVMNLLKNKNKKLIFFFKIFDNKY